jgi:hypothetical protein
MITKQINAENYIRDHCHKLHMETVVIPKQVFAKILTDVETLISDVEIVLDSKVQQRQKDIQSGKERGKTEEEYYSYLAKRGIAIGRVHH